MSGKAGGVVVLCVPGLSLGEPVRLDWEPGGASQAFPSPGRVAAVAWNGLIPVSQVGQALLK